MQQSMLTDTLPMEASVGSSSDPSNIARVRDKLLELHEEHRIVLCLHFVEQLSLKEIGLLLDDSEENIREVFVEAVCLISGRNYRKRDAA